MSLIEAIILAILEGLTEFLPISSTGHLIVAAAVMGIGDEEFTKTFSVAIQLGAILSVLVLYWKRFLQSFNFYLILLVGFIPSVIIGLLLGGWIEQLFERVDVVGYALLLGGVALIFIDKAFTHSPAAQENEVGYKTAFIVGCFQCLAFIMPGLSRSAATIIGGLTQKLSRKTAAEFSFFLAVPTMFGATAYKLGKFLYQGGTFTTDQINILIIGNLVAFVVAWIAIRSFINFLNRNGFKLFGYYRIVIGLIILILYYSGYSFALL
jgi:undecaprenyl-diphosphatase